MDLNQSYEQYYNIALLDDLHNYFPDILYGDRNRFRSVNDLLDYIRSETRNRFDLFTSAQRRRLRENDVNDQRNDQIRIIFSTDDYVPTNQASTSTQLAQAHLAAAQAAAVAVAPASLGPVGPLGPLGPQRLPSDIAGSLMTLVNLLYPPIDNMVPVVVRPTQEQITNATSIIELPNNTEICAICQESMTDSQQIRRINHCRHSFHDTCINTHFRSNVRCPNCRYDIRT